MDFHSQFEALIRDCKEYQKIVDAKSLHFVQPYQSLYLDINKVLKIHTEQKLKLEAIAAGEQSAPGFPNLTPARREYYELEAEVPAFLAGGSNAYYYLQRYKIACTYLVKTFSYSTYKGDWQKMRELGNWLAAIYNQQQQSNDKESLEGSFDHLRDLGNFDSLEPKELQELEEEVRNIQALLAENKELEGSLTPEDAALLQEAADFLHTKEEVLKGLPEIDNDFKYDEPPVVEVVAYRCKQLTVLLDHFHEDYAANTPVIELTQFKQELRDSFDLHIGICADIYNSILDAMGSLRDLDIKKLCQLIHNGLELFVNEGFMYERYGMTIPVNHITATQGMPDTIDLEMLLLVAVGDI